MKKQILFLTGALFLMPLILLGQNTKVSSVKLKSEQMTGWRGKGLYGKVKTVVDSEGDVTTFNPLGNIISKKWKNGSGNNYLYIALTRYTINGHGPFNITFTDNKRLETDSKEPEIPDQYTFDSEGRVIEYQYLSWPAKATETYTYRGSEKLPYKMVLHDYDEYGDYLYTNIYQYITIDTHGNWTKRKVDSTLKTKEYVENGNDKITTETRTVYETRTITYYPDRTAGSLNANEKSSENKGIKSYGKANTITTTNDPIDVFLGKGNLKIPGNGEFVASAPNTVAVGKQFRLNYTIGIDNVDNFKAPSLNNFNVLMGPSRSISTSTEVIKGAVTSKSSITYTFVLQAEKTGSFTIPGAIAESKGKTYTSNAVTIKVTSK